VRLPAWFPNSFTAFGLALLVVQVAALFTPFAETAAEPRLGLVFLADSAKDLAHALADVFDAAARRVTFAEILPFPPPNLSGLAAVAAILICGLFTCEQTPPRWLGGVALLTLCCSLLSLHPYSQQQERLLAGGMVWLAISVVAGLSCFAAPRPVVRRRRVGAPIRLTIAPEPSPPMIWTRTPRVLIRR
jgi:hypothetical protein